MGLFDMFKKKANAWDDAYKANPKFYSKPDVDPFCAYTLTETADTILPKAPRFAISGKEVTTYKLMLVSITKNSVVGDLDYFEAVKKLEPFILDQNSTNILVRGLSLSELEGLLK